MVEHSKLMLDWVLELAGIAREMGFRYVDYPVAGRRGGGGQAGDLRRRDEADLEEIRPLIQPISKEIFRFGPVGTGTAFKLVYNLLGVVQIVGLAEALTAAEAAGIDLDTAARALINGNTGSGHVAKHVPFMASGVHEDPHGFSAANRVKDTTYGLALEEKLDEDPVVGRAALVAWRDMDEAGVADAADSRLIDAVRLRCR